MFRLTICLLCLMAASEAYARLPWQRKPTYPAQKIQASAQIYTHQTTTQTHTTATVPSTTEEVHEALAEVNAARARRGLRPFIKDDLLTQGAITLALTRARGLIRGHLASDFALLPPGANARATGCGALEPSWGFQACAVYDSFTYAGAATARGRDGRLYHHLVVR